MQVFLSCLLGMAAICASQNVDYNWSYIEQFGLNGAWSAVGSDYSGQHLVVSQRYTDYPVLISSDYGSNWMRSDFAPFLTNGFIEFSSSSDGQYVTGVTDKQGLWVSDNYGYNFTYIFNHTSPTSNIYFTDVDISGDGVFQYVSIYGGNLWKSVDSGVTWNVMNVSTVDSYGTPVVLSTMGWSSVATSADGSHVYIAASWSYYGGMPMVLYSYDFGVTWGVAYYYIYSFTDLTCSQSGQYVAMFNPGYPYGQENVYVSNDFGKTFNATFGFSNLVQGAYPFFFDLNMDGTGKTIALATQGGGIYISSSYGANGSWYNTSLPVKNQYGSNARYESVAIDQTGRYLFTVPSNGACYTTHNYTWEEPTDDKPDLSGPIGFSLIGIGLGMLFFMVVGIYVKEFYLTGRSITTMFDKPHPQHLKKNKPTTTTGATEGVSERLIADSSSSSAPPAPEVDLTEV